MRYNKKKEAPAAQAVATHQGGVGFQSSPEVALLNLLAAGLDKTYYEGSNEREKRLVSLIQEVAAKDKYFAAQCIVYARAVYGQRTVTHRAAVELARLLSGEEWGKRFFGRWDKKNQMGGIIYRLDDILEIAGCYFHFNSGKNLSNPMKKGFAQALHTADEFELARYRGDGRDVSMIDIFNLVRPIPSNENKNAFLKLMTGKLVQTETSEALNSDAGRTVSEMVKAGAVTKAEAAEILTDMKGANWKELIPKAGYLNLLRNIKNIAAADSTLVKKLGKRLTERDFIKKSLVFPHQIDLALEFLLDQLNGSVRNEVVGFLDQAYELSVDNVKELGMDEYTAVVIDTSGSMGGSGYSASVVDEKGSRINKSPAEKAALIGATLAKGLGADVYQFADTTAEFKLNPNDSINTLKKQLMSKNGSVGHGTQLDSAFGFFNSYGRSYKRVFVISDMQIADSLIANTSAYKAYTQRVGTPYIYAINLCGYGTQVLKSGSQFFNIAGYSQQIYTTAKQYEVDPQALINEVRKIKI